MSTIFLLVYSVCIIDFAATEEFTKRVRDMSSQLLMYRGIDRYCIQCHKQLRRHLPNPVYCLVPVLVFHPPCTSRARGSSLSSFRRCIRNIDSLFWTLIYMNRKSNYSHRKKLRIQKMDRHFSRTFIPTFLLHGCYLLLSIHACMQLTINEEKLS